MPTIRVILDGDNCWPELAKKADALITMMGPAGAPLQLALLRDATAPGNSTVTLRVDLPDGRILLAETTLALFLTAADMLRAGAAQGG